MRIFSIFLAVFFLAACNTKKKTATPEIIEPVMVDEGFTEERILDTMVISAPRIDNLEEVVSIAPEEYELEEYNPSHERVNDLIHTSLDLKFDWEEEKVIGSASLLLSPFFYPTDSVVLDAKDLEFQKITLDGVKKQLPYEYDGEKVTIKLDKEYLKGEEYTINLSYSAVPSESGGSDAITSNQGLFFIKPDKNSPDKPYQIWTQGETEWNSRWFPTIDHPNERTTQEIRLTVEDKYTTLSNGLLLSSNKNSDGTRTDHWKLDQPHAPYLFMIAIGEYAKVAETWKDIPVEYYVEPEYKSSAKAIFAHTPEMLTYFSDLLGMEYPWPKYSQIVVRDYVSGAMENTTSVIYGEFVQLEARELIDNNNDRIVAHELIHHWFGDLVTCESWANLTMNEGFANYGEYLWFEHKYGRDEADYHLLNEWSQHIGSSKSNSHPLIHFSYDDNEDMFDTHSYNKGGAVLHMLRKYVGNKAFFAALNLYLNTHKYNSVEAHDLRLAFEEVTGKDLNWFFNQWYFAEGHPELEITYGYDESSKMATVTVEQLQDPTVSPAIFQLPVAIDLYQADGSAIRKNVMVDKRLQTFSFLFDQKPALINFDGERMLLAETSDNKTEEEYFFQFYHAPLFLDRFEALQSIAASEGENAQQLYQKALEDDYWVIKSMAIRLLEENPADEVINKVRTLAINDPNSYVRTLSLDLLSNISDEASVPVAINAIKNDSAYHVISSGLYLLYSLKPDTAAEYAEKLIDDDNPQIMEVVEIILGESGDPKYLDYYEERMDDFDGMSGISFFSHYQQLAAAAGPEKAMAAMTGLKNIGKDSDESQWRRVGATKAIHDMRTFYEEQVAEMEDSDKKEKLNQNIEKLSAMIKEIKANETDEEVKAIYQQLQID